MNKCKSGKHNLIEIFRARGDIFGDVDAVVRWCAYCGAVVIDEEFDNRLNPGSILKMQFPKIMKKGALNG